ncbi:MAG: SAM-dependent methyltransferase [Candidatus Azotimanducaceae bacterium]|jgi:SAM-dependent methyltransferase
MNEPSDFYTGLVAELYEPLAGGITDSARFIRFVRDHGEPALEICCGTGLPLLDLLEAGLDVEGLDSSKDMLKLCAVAARDRGVVVNLHHSMMQQFQLERKFRSVYVANGSITLLTNDDDLCKTLESIVRCLAPGGTVMFDLDIPDVDMLRKYIGHFKEKQDAGITFRVGITSIVSGEDGRNVIMNLRYEHVGLDGSVEAIDRPWSRRIWSLEQFSLLLDESGLAVVGVQQLAGDVIQICANIGHGVLRE